MPAMPSTKVAVAYERVETKVPVGLYRQLEEAVRSQQLWPSRQDFVIEAIKEKLERLSSPDESPRRPPKRARG